ncbi:MAG: hypothetical protein ISS31_06025 [Kiritimatiellae bacterium]|nr:hypothetical protein [Kiritimatiellia bacterium]
MKPGIRNTLHVWERIFFRVLTALLCALVLVSIWLSRVGLPDRMGEALMRRIDTGQFAVEAKTIRMGLIKGVRLEDVSLYRRGQVGPPAVEATSVILWVDPLAVLRGMSTVQRVEICDGEVRPEFACADRKQDGAMSVGTYQTELMLTGCRVQGVSVESLRGRLRLADTTAQLNDIQMTLARNGLQGTASGHVEYDCRTDLVSGQGDAAMYPEIVEPVLAAWDLNGLVRLFSRFEFENGPPTASLTFQVGAGEGGPVVFDGDAHLESARYRGVEALRADVALHVVSTNSSTIVTLDPLTVLRRDGSVQGALVIDLGQETVRFDARGSLNPHLMRQAINVLSDPFWDRWTFDGPVVIEAKGVVGYEDLQGTDFTLRFDGREVSYTNHLLDRCTFDMQMIDGGVDLSSIRVGMYGGEATGVASFLLPGSDGSNTAFDVSLNATNMDFEHVAAVLINDDEREYRGRLSGCLALRGVLGEGNADTLQGDGTITIDDGRVFMLPVFGGLSEIMTRIIPGLDFVLRQSDASTDFRIAESRISSDEIRINGSVLSLKGRGHYGFDEAIDFHAQVKLMKDNNMVARLVRVLTFPISKLFEFRVRGTLDESRWYPENFSGDLLEKIGLRKSD